MKRRDKMLLIISGVLVAGILAAMHGFLLPKIQVAAGGIACFDLQSLGYTHETATAFLTNLTDAGRGLYLHAYLPLDFVFLAVYTVFFAVALRALFQTHRFLWAPLALAAADIAENVLTIRMLTGTDVTAALTNFAGRVTLCKTILMTITILMVLVGLINYIVSARKKRKKATDRKS